jgi:TrmH family RNA methyltransferase
VSGLSKNKIKWIRSLHQKKYRDELGLFLVEGEKMVLEAIEFFPQFIDFIGHTSDFNFQVNDNSIERIEISNTELEQISTLKTPNKALAILKKPVFKLPETTETLILGLDSIQDPGNLGTIMRIADWYGIKDIVCSSATVDCFNPKVVQASMGAIFRIQVHYTDLKSWLKKQNKSVYGALLEGENIYTITDLPIGVLLMGNEGKGISPSLMECITHPISIPRFGQAESLNVSVATGILVSEFARKSFS